MNPTIERAAAPVPGYRRASRVAFDRNLGGIRTPIDASMASRSSFDGRDLE